MFDYLISGLFIGYFISKEITNIIYEWILRKGREMEEKNGQ